MPLDYHSGNVTFWIFQIETNRDEERKTASARARISLSDEAEKRGRETGGQRERGEERRVTRVKVRVLVNYETPLSIRGKLRAIKESSATCPSEIFGRHFER